MPDKGQYVLSDRLAGKYRKGPDEDNCSMPVAEGKEICDGGSTVGRNEAVHIFEEGGE